MTKRRAEGSGRRDSRDPLDGTIFVLGKGGVGKSVISEGLAAHASSTSRRALLVRIGETLRADPAAARAPTPSKNGFDEIDLDARLAMDEFVRHVVRLRPLAERITGSEVYRKFFAAAPGLPELVLLGRIREYANETNRHGDPKWQAIVVDCPSSGHGLLMLETPFAAFRAVPIGPFARLASQIVDWLATARIALVAIPEEMAVVEAIELKDELLERTGLKPTLACLNRMRRETLSAAARALASGDDVAAPGSYDRLLLDCAARAQRRSRLEAFHLRRLARGIGLEPVLVGELANCRPATVAAALAEAMP